MDRIFMDLLKDFECGEISRRRLMQSLVVGSVTTAVSTMFASPVNAEIAKAFKATAVNHISYNVADYAKSRDFYMDLLGMRLTFDDGRGCALEFGGLKAPNSLYIRNAKPGEKANVDHMALSVANWKPAESEAILTRVLKPLGTTPKFDGDAAWYAWDPDGYIVQVCAEKGVYPGAAIHGFDAKPGIDGAAKINVTRSKSNRGFKAIAFNHIAYRTADYTKSRDWFMEVFAMKLAFDEGMGCGLEFGDPKSPDSLYIRNFKQGQKANVDHLAYSVADFNPQDAEAELKRRGLDPKADGEGAWTVHDLDGYTFQICGQKPAHNK